MSGRRQRGFSMIELMITVVVAAIVLAIAAPNFRDAMARARVSGNASELHAALSLARAEALKLKSPVVVCAAQTRFTCLGEGGFWNWGFLVFHDRNGNRVRDDGENILRSRVFFGESAEASITGTAPQVTFLGNGRLEEFGVDINILGQGCDAGNPVGADTGKRRRISAVRSGRITTARLACGRADP